MNVPDLVQAYSLEELIEVEKGIFESLYPNVLGSESDYYMPVIESWAESMFRLRTEINYNFKQQFWMNAENEGLDYAASFFGVTRLDGTKPVASFSFRLSAVQNIDTTIPAGIVLGSSNNETATTLNDIVIPAGSISAEGLAELNVYVESSTTKTEDILTTIPFVSQATQLGNYQNGKAIEGDEALRRRVSLSLETLSAAGPISAYQARALNADSRVKDVSVFEVNGRVQIVIDSETWDATLVQRVNDACSAADVRPLNDQLDIYQAEVLTENVAATLTVQEGYDALSAVNSATTAILALAPFRIGQLLSVSAIIDACMVEGVIDVGISSPLSNVTPTRTQVVRLGTVGVSYV